MSIKIFKTNTMKVIGFNGSPNKNGNTAISMLRVFEELEKAGIETELIHVGMEKIQGCTACQSCVKTQNECCIKKGDLVNEWIQKMKEADGILLGSPVHYSGIAGTMKSFLDRAFYVASVNKGMFRHKVGASVAAVRRSGGIPTIDALNKFISYSEMIMPSSNYWAVAHGTTPGETTKDDEGNQIMEVLGQNMAWIMKIIEHGKAEIPAPAPVKKSWTHFIR